MCFAILMTAARNKFTRLGRSTASAVLLVIYLLIFIIVDKSAEPVNFSKIFFLDCFTVIKKDQTEDSRRYYRNAVRSWGSSFLSVGNHISSID